MNGIFSGNESANPIELCDALGWAGDLKQEDVVGALMSLCRTVAEQGKRIDAMTEELRCVVAVTPNV